LLDHGQAFAELEAGDGPLGIDVEGQGDGCVCVVPAQRVGRTFERQVGVAGAHAGATDEASGDGVRCLEHIVGEESESALGAAQVGGAHAG